MLLTSNAPSQDLNSFVYIKTNADIRPGYSQDKNSGIDLKESNKTGYYI